MRFLIYFCVLLSGCASNNISNKGALIEDRSTKYKPKVSKFADSSGYEGKTVLPSENLHQENIIYFDYDSAIVLKEYDDVLLKVSAYLMKNPQKKVVLEGHTDERGTREYNLALGEKRANSVLKQLNILGVSTSQMKSLSFGEENPSALGLEDDILALNRRVEIIY